MKKKLLIIIALFFAVKGESQQMGLSSHYMFNDFLYNPGIAGVKDYLPVTLGFRKQWVGIPDAPVSEYLTAHGFSGMNLGVGLTLTNQVAGPTRKTSFGFTTSYHLKLSKDRRDPKALSFGITALLTQHNFNVAKLTTYETGDHALERNINHQVIPDANFGVYYHEGNKYYVGLSVFNMVQTKRDLFEVVTSFDNSVKRHYYLMAGGNIVINDELRIQPSVLGEMIEALPWQAEANAKAIWKNDYILGFGYRYKEGIIAAIGIQKGIFRITYSYDYTVSDLSAFSIGSHEISITGFMKKTSSGPSSLFGGPKKFRDGEFKPVITDF